MKMGGIFVKSSVMSRDMHFNIGIGFNVDNSNPTICVNDLIHHHNTLTGQQLAPLSIPSVIARTLTVFEKLVGKFEKEGPEAVLELYYKYWLHGGSDVQLEAEGSHHCTVVGLDEYGYLLVETPNGSRQSVHPDGNSFDMMKNLIFAKSG